MIFSRSLKAYAVTSALALAACQPATDTTNSNIKVTDIADSQIKWQSIGNCWVYAAVGWVESVLLEAGQEERNFSETYLTYRHYEEQLMRGSLKIQTGGWFYTARDLMQTHGLMNEGDFIPGEADETFSTVQMLATGFLENKLADEAFKLKLSSLSGKAKRQMVTDLLDEAFGVKMSLLADKIIQTKDLEFAKSENEVSNIYDELNSWTQISHLGYWDYQSSGLSEEDLPSLGTNWNSEKKVSVEKRVMRALNDKKPVVLNWFVDFNAQDEQGIFSFALLKEQGPGRQGLHSTVIEDYAVEILDPVTGEVIKEIGEGDVSEEEKLEAETNGRIKYLVVKNSWGGLERMDRPSYVRDGVGGYARLEQDYLFGWMKRIDENPSPWYPAVETGIHSFEIPMGY